MTVRVAVLMGGTSGERDVSLSSGRDVALALKNSGFEVCPVEIEPDGSWSLAGSRLDVSDVLPVLRRECELIFLALHGGFGEDGTLQGFLDMGGLRYVGSGVCASALAMSKILSRRVAADLGFVVAPAVEGVVETAADASALGESARRLPLPVFVKPDHSGSSVGVARVERREDLGTAIEQSLSEGAHVLIEAEVVGREVSVPVLGDAHRGAQALPVVEVAPRESAFFDYRAKYNQGETEEICPARLDEVRTREVQRAAERLHDAFGCLSLSRTDFIVPEDERPAVFLEVNTLPGMTPLSLLPLAAKVAGMTYEQLCTRLVEQAIERYRRRS